MATEGRSLLAGIRAVLILVTFVTCWSRSVNGDHASFSNIYPIQIPFIPSISDVGNVLLPKIRGPSCFFQDATALLSFRAQLSDPADALSSWNLMTDCCEWRGITCSASSSQRRVTGLRLSVEGHESEESFLSMSATSNGVAGVPLSGLSALETLSLTGVAFNDVLPVAWGLLSNLSSLELVNCNFTGAIPLTYGVLHNLRHLCLSDNMLAGRLPLHMAQVFSQLRTLDLSSNGFTGGIELLLSSTLTFLDIAHNEFSNDPIPDLFGLLPNLRHLDLSHNAFRGPIPRSLELVQHLKFLDLSANQLDGFIPPGLLFNKVLTSVFLHDNNISGTIPTLFPTASPIEELDLSNNSLSGYIPPTIGALAHLQSLDLSYNILSGGIPDALFFNSKLEFLFLENNQLVGFIPPELASLENLVLTNVSHNFLIGPIPEGGAWPTFPASSFTDNVGLCGAPLKRCPFTM